MRFFNPLRVNLVVAALGAALALPAGAFDDLDDMPDGPGREEAFYTCIACHSMQVVTRQGMTRAMWDDTIRLMVDRHGMPELEPEEEELILSYLAEHFPAAGAGGRRGWTNPFAP
jgi:hypothetical protein